MKTLLIVSLIFCGQIAFAVEKSKIEKYHINCQGEVILQVMAMIRVDHDHVKKIAKGRCESTQKFWDDANWKNVDNFSLQGCKDAALIVAELVGAEGKELTARAAQITKDRCSDLMNKKN